MRACQAEVRSALREGIRSASDRLSHTVAQARNWLRPVMPRVAVAAAVSFVVWLLVRNIRVYRTSSVSWLFGLITFLALSFTITYFGLKMLRWLERRLLWRVRRRLVITYLLVGLTPIVLLTLLGIALAIGGSNRALMRVVTAQMDATAKEALANVRNIAEALGRLPPRAGDESIKSWLDERTASLQPSLPGAYVALWRSGTEKDTVMLGHHEVAKIVSWPEDEKTRGVGSDPTPAGAPLPDWLRGRAEWSGLSE
jgi:hypothetical protein